MKKQSRAGAATLVLLAGLALLGPWWAGTAAAPSVAPTAIQLLPPGALVEHVNLAGGGFVRALSIEPIDDGLKLRSSAGWRELRGLRAAGPKVPLRLWLGTDHQGRSVLARTLHGARTSLSVGLLATLLAVGLGTAIGLTSALAGKLARPTIEIATDGLLALPRILLLLMLASLLRGSVAGTAVAIGLASWMEVARLVQAESDRLGGRPFLAAVRASGAGPLRLALRHLLPNLSAILVVVTPLVATEAILLESTLAYLGIAGGNTASWGSMVADGQRLLPGGWWIAVFPGLLLCLTALAVHGIGVSRDRSAGVSVSA